MKKSCIFPAGRQEVSPKTVRWGGTLLPKAIGRAMEWPDSCPKRNVPAARATSREKVKLKNPQIFQFYKKIIKIPLNMARANAEAILNRFFIEISTSK